jgi:hypothetical protein
MKLGIAKEIYVLEPTKDQLIEKWMENVFIFLYFQEFYGKVRKQEIYVLFDQ